LKYHRIPRWEACNYKTKMWSVCNLT
jgi:hypothetical protein